MHTDELNIESELENYNQLIEVIDRAGQDKLLLLNIAKRQQEVLRQLRAEIGRKDAIIQLFHDEFEQQKALNEQKDIQIKELEQYIANFRQNTTINVAGSYIGNQNIGIQYKLPPALPKHRTGKNKSSINNPKQLSLWMKM